MDMGDPKPEPVTEAKETTEASNEVKDIPAQNDGSAKEKDTSNVVIESNGVTEEAAVTAVSPNDHNNTDKTINGVTTNGDVAKSETSNESITQKAAETEEAPPKTPMKTVEGVVGRLKNDTSMSDSDKIDTLCLLVQRIVEENSSLKSEIQLVIEQCEKQKEAKEAIKTLNEAYKRQIDLVREESKLRLEEEQAKRQAGMGGYSSTMTDLSNLLETHTEQNTRLRDQNTDMAQRMGELIGESEKRDKYITQSQTEAKLHITLLEHQVQKANIEKAEVKADMTKERLALSQELLMERERSSNLEDTVRILKEQGELYQAQLSELQTGAGQSTKSFQHFKTQIEKLTAAMSQLEKDTATWQHKYEVSSGQVKKMNTATMERENEITALKKKLDSMVKLNKTLNEERAALQEKVKQAAV